MSVSTENQSQGSAKIYQFPLGGRGGLKTGRQDVTASNTARSQFVVDSGAFYHEAAIAEERARQC